MDIPRHRNRSHMHCISNIQKFCKNQPLYHTLTVEYNDVVPFPHRADPINNFPQEAGSIYFHLISFLFNRPFIIFIHLYNHASTFPGQIAFYSALHIGIPSVRCKNWKTKLETLYNTTLTHINMAIKVTNIYLKWTDRDHAQTQNYVRRVPIPHRVRDSN